MGTKLVRLAKVARYYGVHPNTIFRWARAGVKSRSGRTVRLEMWRLGGRNATTMEAVELFLERLDDVEYLPPPDPKRQAALDKQAAQAMKILRDRGVLTDED